MTHWLGSWDIVSSAPAGCWPTTSRETSGTGTHEGNDQEPKAFHPVIFRPSLATIIRRRYSIQTGPAHRHQFETPTFHVPVDARHLFFAQEPGPARHPLVFSAWHGHRQKLLRGHAGLQGMSKVGPELAFGGVRPVAAVAVRVVQRVAAEHVFGDLLVAALDKEGKVQRDRLAVLKLVGVFLDVGALVRAGVVSFSDRIHRTISWSSASSDLDAAACACRPSYRSRRPECAGRAGSRHRLLPGILFRDRVIGRSNDRAVRGVTGGAVASLVSCSPVGGLPACGPRRAQGARLDRIARRTSVTMNRATMREMLRS